MVKIQLGRWYRGDIMDDALLNIVLERLDAKPLPDEAAGLLLAACESEESLAAQLGDPSAPAPARDRVGETTDAAEPAGAYLRSVTVTGFRGVGAPATLPIEPGPGLTLVLGRNGSGKSSFAEGLEVLLTGDMKRWEKLSAVWHEGWRNLQTPGEAEISAKLLLEDGGLAVARRTWASGTAFAASSAAVQITGEKRAGLDRLGWLDDLVTYRPFLSHTELEAFFREPSHVYDLLSSVLGLEQLKTAEQRLAAERKKREDARKEIKNRLPAVLDQLNAIDDERAAACVTALTAKRPDIDRAVAVAQGATPETSDSEIGLLRSLSQLTVPSEDQVRAAVTALHQAAGGLEAAAGSKAGQARALAGLLTSALAHYQMHGAGDCPVCGGPGALDEQWRTHTEGHIARLRAEASGAEQAEAQARNATDQARALVLPAPVQLSAPPPANVDAQPASAAWENWAAYPKEAGLAGLRKLAGHIEQAWPPLRAAVAALAAQATTELHAREDRWAPVAAQITTWCAAAKQADEQAAAVPALTKAITWLKGATDDIRNARLQPLADQARAIWAKLRQESDIDLGAIRLSGSGNRRQADLNVTVDGTPGAALGVMSQGEVNALALSIFLPRATMPASPFRFLVIDDPVQAMDPAKVDGLARVLEEVSHSRQVIVFTHDDRLADALRLLNISADVLEVTRRPGSIVDVRRALDPVEQQLTDAGALCADEALPENVAVQVIPGLCRLAVEAAFTDAIRRKQLSAGRRHADVEADLEKADKLTKRAALALFGDASRGGDVLPHLNAWGHSAADTYRALNKGAHDGYRGDLRSLISQTRRLTETIRARLS